MIVATTSGVLFCGWILWESWEWFNFAFGRGYEQNHENPPVAGNGSATRIYLTYRTYFARAAYWLVRGYQVRRLHVTVDAHR